MAAIRRRRRLRASIQLERIGHFVAGVPARTAAKLGGVNRNTAILHFHTLREMIAQRLAEEAPFLDGARKGKRGRGAVGKVSAFGLLKRGGSVHTIMISDAKSRTLLGIIRKRLKPASVVYTDGFTSYDVLDVSEFRHHRINHSEKFAEARNHIIGIENFWSQAKRPKRRYNGIPKDHSHLLLKECEWRFNHRPADNLLRTLREWAKV